MFGVLGKAVNFSNAKPEISEGREVFPDDTDVPKPRSKWMMWALAIFIVVIVASVVRNYFVVKHEDAARRLDAAVQLMRGGQNELALSKLDEAVALSPEWALLYYNRAVAHSRLKHTENAIADYTRALDLKYEHSDQAYVGRARQYFGSDRFDLALADCSRSIEIKPNAHAYGTRAHLLLEDGQFEKAQDDLNSALQLNPNDAYALYVRGYIFMSSGDMGQAAQFAVRLQRDSESPRLGHVLMGDILWGRDDMAGAIGEYSKAIDSEKRDATAYSSRGRCRLDQGDIDAAIADYSTAIEVEPRMVAAFRGRAQAYRLRGEEEKARKDIDRIMESKMHWAGSYFVRAWAWADKDDMARALDDMRVASAKLAWGWTSDYGEAVVYCARARNLPAESTGADSRKANIDKAIEHLQAAAKKGFKSWKAIAHDSDFKVLLDDPRFQALMTAQ